MIDTNTKNTDNKMTQHKTTILKIGLGLETETTPVLDKKETYETLSPTCNKLLVVKQINNTNYMHVQNILMLIIITNILV